MRNGKVEKPTPPPTQMIREGVDPNKKHKGEPNAYAINFLLLNGFDLVRGNNHYYNGMCQVIINKDHYEIKDGEGSIYSKDLNIYWLVGLLTWNNYIPKNYKTI